MDKFQRGFKILNEVHNSSESKILGFVDRFRLPIYYFEAAYKDLTDKTKYIEENFDETVENRHNFPNDLAQVTRYIFVYLVSAHSLRDCQKSYVELLYKEHNIEIPEFNKERSARFKNHPIPNIISVMRNRYSHSMPPICSKTLNISEGKIIITLPQTDNINLYNKLNLQGKVYWDSFTHKELNLIEMFEEYHTLIMDFYSWFLNSIDKALEPVKNIYFDKKEQGVRLTREYFFEDFMSKQGDVNYDLVHELMQFSRKDQYDELMKCSQDQKVENLILMLVNDGILHQQDLNKFKEHYILRYVNNNHCQRKYQCNMNQN